MPSISVTQAMPRPASEVFALLHDYPRRLEWDTLLREARLTRGHTEAKKGATSLCVGKPFLGLIGVETKYLTYDPGKIAAVQMINSPPFFQSFAASIRHQNTPTGSSATYKLYFTAKPRLLRWLLHPLMLLALKIETRKRLTALSSFLETEPHPDLDQPITTVVRELLSVWSLRLTRMEKQPSKFARANLEEIRLIVKSLQQMDPEETIDLLCTEAQWSFTDKGSKLIGRLTIS